MQQLATLTVIPAVVLAVLISLGACFSEQDLGRTPADEDADGGVSSGANACPERMCASGEVCFGGVCQPRSTDPGTCVKGAPSEDHCAVDAMCMGTKNESYCQLLQPCGPGDACPVGLMGSVCNRDYAPNKARVCVPGQCAQASDCPASLRCLTTIGVVGFCSNGDPGSPCVEAGDCKSGTCASPGAGFGLCF